MDIGAFSPEQAREILEVVRMVKSSPLMTLRGMQTANKGLERNVYVVKNEATTAVIPFGCMQVTGTEELNGRTYCLVNQPADTDGTAGWYLFNGPNEIDADGGLGNGYDGPYVRVATDATSITAGDKYQPIVDDWKVEAGGTLIVAAGQDHIRDEGVMSGFIASAGGGGGAKIFKTQIGGIPARSGTTAGKADATPYYIDVTTDTITEELDGDGYSQDITVYNISGTPIDELTYIQAQKIGDVYVADMEDCS